LSWICLGFEHVWTCRWFIVCLIHIWLSLCHLFKFSDVTRSFIFITPGFPPFIICLGTWTMSRACISWKCCHWPGIRDGLLSRPLRDLIAPFCKAHKLSLYFSFSFTHRGRCFT
jgi:hypothetical protein